MTSNLKLFTSYFETYYQYILQSAIFLTSLLSRSSHPLVSLLEISGMEERVLIASLYKIYLKENKNSKNMFVINNIISKKEHFLPIKNS